MGPWSGFEWEKKNVGNTVITVIMYTTILKKCKMYMF